MSGATVAGVSGAWIALNILLPVVAADNLALLAGTLRTFQKAACDEEWVSLRCPRGTSITIQVAQYGGAGGGAGGACDRQFDPVAVEVVGNTTCVWPNALQYSLLQTVVEACQKKQQCRFLTSPRALGGDPCPGARKFVEVAYKCRPYEFRSKVGCERDVLQLSCNPHSRVAVYSASYGRTQYESIQCPQPQGVPEETCLVPYATETVMHICHGKRRCTLTADTSTFGTPCKKDSRTYLKVVYTCVPRKVLKERYEGTLEEDELPSPLAPHAAPAPPGEADDFYDTDPSEEHYPAAIPPAPKVAVEHPPAAATGPPRAPSPHQPADDRRHDAAPAEDAAGRRWGGRSELVYALASVVAAGALCACGLLARCALRRRARADNKPAAAADRAATELPLGFTDTISEVDNDIDMDIANVSGSLGADVTDGKARVRFAEPAYPRVVPNVYPHARALSLAVPGMYGPAPAAPAAPAHPADLLVSPRSLSRYSNAQYYYG